MTLEMKTVCFLGMGLLLGAIACTEQNPRVTTRWNQAAALTGNLPTNPLQWKVITSAINLKEETMYTVFGNDQAVQYARTNAGHDYPAGSVIAQVTWKQQEDPRWFGGRIPEAPKSVEFVTVRAGTNQRPLYSYEFYEGAPLKRVSLEEGATPDARTAHLLSQRAAVMP